MSGKIGIFLPGQNGDIMTAMSVLRYKNTIWPDKEIIWYVNQKMPVSDVLKYAPVTLRHWPEGWGLPERCAVDGPLAVAKGEEPWADFSVLKTKNNRLDQNLKYNFELTADLDEGYFPAPWMLSVEDRAGIDYPNISRKIFGADPSLQWHPLLSFSAEEQAAVKDFCRSLPHDKTIMLETFIGSGVGAWNDNMTTNTMRICREKFGRCNFIFASHKDNSRFFDDVGVVSCGQFTVRQTALVNNYSDLFIGVGSGISVATSCWDNKPTPKIQYTGSFIGSTVTLANGPIELIETDPPAYNPAQKYYQKLEEVLNRIA